MELEVQQHRTSSCRNTPLQEGGVFRLPLPLPLLKTSSDTMSRNGKNPKLDLKLNLSPPRANRDESPNRSTSPPSSCVSSELGAETDPDQVLRCSNSPEATSMVLVGCPRCLMYVMLSEEEPKCPKCKSTVLLDFLNDTTFKKTRKS